MLEYPKIMVDKLIDMFSSSSNIKKLNNANYEGQVSDILKNKFENKDLGRVKADLDSLYIEGQIKQKLENQKKLLLKKNHEKVMMKFMIC